MQNPDRAEAGVQTKTSPIVKEPPRESLDRHAPEVRASTRQADGDRFKLRQYLACRGIDDIGPTDIGA